VEYRDSVAIGAPEAGSLVQGVKLPPNGRHYFTWDPVKHESPSPPWRRWGTDDLVRTVLRVIHEYARAHPAAPRVGIGDLSLPEGGYFGPEIGGGIGHATHQNGLDADLYYPIRPDEERAPLRVDEIRMRLAQDLVDRFVAAGADTIYVGPNTPLTGPPGVVVPLANHDNHLHVRIGG
jgi:murein endopeptidase